MNPPQPIPAFLPEHRPYDVDPMAFINAYHIVDAFALLCVAIFLYFVIAIVTTGKRRLIALSVAGVPLSVMATVAVAMAFFPHSSIAQSITPPEDIAHVDYVATAPLTPGAQCPYLPDEQYVGVDTTWAHDGCVIYNNNGDIVETITIRALPHGTSYAVKDELFSIKHGMKITDEERYAPIVNPDPMIDSQGHARAIYIDNNAALSSTRMEKLPEPLAISISVDNHAGDTDTARKHLYAVREHLGLT